MPRCGGIVPSRSTGQFLSSGILHEGQDDRTRLLAQSAEVEARGLQTCCRRVVRASECFADGLRWRQALKAGRTSLRQRRQGMAASGKAIFCVQREVNRVRVPRTHKSQAMPLAPRKLRVPLGVQVGAVAALFVAALVALWATGASVVARERRRSEAKNLLESSPAPTWRTVESRSSPAGASFRTSPRRRLDPGSTASSQPRPPRRWQIMKPSRAATSSRGSRIFLARLRPREGSQRP